ncbi:MAG: hypothetical protein RI947_133 [Candidatus Parcubacteria bacterium]
MVFAEVIICGGGSCESTLPISKDSLQTLWREKGIWKSVGLIFSRCMGQCEEAVSMRILTKNATYTLTNVYDISTLESIIKWAEDIHTSQKLLPLPKELQALVHNHFIA